MTIKRFNTSTNNNQTIEFNTRSNVKNMHAIKKKTLDIDIIPTQKLMLETS